MRTISSTAITDLVEKLCIEACVNLSPDIEAAMQQGAERDRSPLARNVLNTIIENVHIARSERAPMCQDTGMTVIFVDMGQDLHVEGDLIEDAINEGVRRGYTHGYLRKSVVSDPIHRHNTGDNTPAVIHYRIVPGDKMHITVAPKGFGSENKSALTMLTPSQGVAGIKQFVLDTISHAGGNPCPPIIVGVGIGGTMERSAELAKRALLRPIGERHPDPAVAEIEEELLQEINKMGIGPAGFGGDTTALAVAINTGATHIAGLPVAVNISCHATRHAEGTL